MAEDEGALETLRRATVAADWELTAGATEEATALGLIDRERPQAVVAFGDYGRLVSLTRERFPATRIVTDRDVPGTDGVAASPEEVRGLLLAFARPGGPVAP